MLLVEVDEIMREIDAEHKRIVEMQGHHVKLQDLMQEQDCEELCRLELNKLQREIFSEEQVEVLP